MCLQGELTKIRRTQDDDDAPKDLVAEMDAVADIENSVAADVHEDTMAGMDAMV